MNWHPYPFLRLLLPLGFGIFFCENVSPHLGPSFWVCSAAFLTAVFFSFRTVDFSKKWQSSAAIFSSIFLLGWQAIFLKNEQNRADHFSKKADLSQPVFLLGKVADEPARTARKWKVQLEIEAVGSSKDALENCSGNLLVYFDTTFSAADFGYGNRLVLESKIEKPMAAAVRGEFDFSKYLHTQNIHYQAFTKSDAVFSISKNKKPSIRKWALESRRRCLEILQKHLGSGDEFAVASGLVVGYRADLSNEIRSAYLQTGAMHALAVSGMHVGGLYWILSWFFERFSRGSRWRRVLEPTVSIAVIWAFAVLSGASASVIRAAVMFTFFLIGRAVRRDSEPINSLASSAFLLLIFEPFWLFDIGFQFSYLAVAGIVFFQKPIHRLLVAPNRFVDFFWKITAAGFAAQLAVLPISILYFHQMSTYFWLSALVVVPLGMPAMLGGFALVFLDVWLPKLAFLIGKGLFGLVWVQNWLLFKIQKLPFAVAEKLWMSGVGAIALYFLIGTAGIWLIQKRPRFLVASAASLCFFSMIFCFEKLQNYEKRQIRLGLFPRKNELSLVAAETVFSADATHFFEDEKAAPVDFPLEKAEPIIRFFDKKIAIVRDEKSLDGPPLAVDFVWIVGGSHVKMEAVFERFPFEKALFDASAPRFRTRIWADECQAMNLDFHNVQADGPFIFDF